MSVSVDVQAFSIAEVAPSFSAGEDGILRESLRKPAFVT
jgi:hypothetical protein